MKASARMRRPRRARATAGVVCAFTALVAAYAACDGTVVARAQTFAPQPGNPASAIGNEAVYAIAVSPAYERTGTVAVMSSPLTQCKSNCQHLWVSHDGGASWKQVAATGWDGGKPMIAVDPKGREAMFTSTSALERSDDGGQTWQAIGNLGFSSLSPRFASDGTIAVGGTGVKPDYEYRNGTTHTIGGSGGTLMDQYFMLSPTWPSGGRNSPALLAAADKQTQYPIIQRCDANLACTGATSLSGSQPFSAPATLIPSDDYANDGVVFAQTGRGIYKSTTGGLTFTPVTLGQPGATTTATPMMALAPGYRDAGPVRTAYVAVFQAFIQGKTSHSAGGIYRTKDGGTSWAPLDSPGPFDQGGFGIAVAPDGRLFGGYMATTAGHAGLLCSTDGGSSWRVSCPAVGTHGSGASKSGNVSGTCGGAACAPATAAAGGPAVGAQDPTGNAGQANQGGDPLGLAGQHQGTGSSSALRWLLLTFAAALVAAAGASAVVRRRRRTSSAGSSEAGS